MSILRYFPHSLADDSLTLKPTAAPGLHRVVITTPKGKLLEEASLYHLQFAEQHYLHSRMARRHRPSMIMLFNATGEPLASCYIDSQGNLLD